MQIVIDTQKDSKEDIRKAAAFLSSLSDGIEKHSDIFSSSESPEQSSATDAFSSMFGDETPVLGESSSEQNIEPEVKEQEPEEVKIIEY